MTFAYCAQDSGIGPSHKHKQLPNVKGRLKTLNVGLGI